MATQTVTPTTTPRTERAVIFDMDGLLVNTEPLAFGASSRILEERYGVSIPHDVMSSLVGLRADECWNRLRELYGMSEGNAELEELQAAYYAPLLREQAEAMPGARELVVTLYDAGYPLAIASSSPLWQIETVLDRLAIRAMIATWASGFEVTRGKPSPDVYLLAAERLGVPPACCVALEDSGPGTQAAKNAGMYAIAVPSAETHGHSFERADLVLPSLVGAASHIVGLLDGHDAARLDVHDR